MPRRRASAFDDLLTIASKLPWKVGLGLAFASYFVLHFVAVGSAQPPAATNPADLGNVVIRGFIHIFALFAQYVIPVGFLIGAAVSFLKGRQASGLLEEARTGRDIASISWQEFERLVGEGFRQQGFKVSERGGASPDGGVDLELTKSGKRYLVQCKQWRSRQVGVSVIRELCGVMATEQAQGGFVVTSGQFTREANEFARRSRIELIDGTQLQKLIGKETDSAASNCPALTPVPVRSTAPACPGCGKPMVERTANKGSMVGQAFWGCQDYPRCRRIVPKIAQQRFGG
jgi:restriction system protein